MKKFLLPLFIIFGLVGCGSTPQAPLQENKEAVLTPASSVTLYSQKLHPSKDLALKAFSVKSYPVNLKKDVMYTGLDSKKAFTFTISPILKYNFEKNYVVLEADISNLLVLRDDAVFEKTTTAQLQTFDVMYSNLSRQHFKIEKTQMNINGFQNQKTTRIIFAIKSLYPTDTMNSSHKYMLNLNDMNVSFSFFNPIYKNDIIIETLKKRQDKAANELLLQSIAQEDVSYYQTLRTHKESYILPEHSIMNMPYDADLDYAIHKHELFFNTGKYKTNSGKYKIIIPEDQIQFDNANANLKNTHSIKTRNTKKRLKKSSDIPDHDNFIDFSEGM